MPGYVLLASEKGSPLTPNEADDNLRNLYDFKAEKTDLEAVEVRTSALETSQAAQDSELGELDTRTSTLEASQTAQDNELADQEVRIGSVEAGLANHDHDAAEVSFAPAGDITATNVQAAIEEVDALKQGIDARGQPDGYAPLDAGGKVPLGLLPDAVTRYKGYYATAPELVAAYPVGTPGDTALVGSTDTLWAWDSDSGSWVNTDSRGNVDSVNGMTGTVALEAADIPFTPVAPFTATESQAAIEQARTMANARWLDSVPVAMAGAADGYLLKVTGPPGSEQVVAVPGVSAGVPASAVRRYFDSTTEIINGVTYFQVKSTPPAPAAVPVTAVNTTTGANAFNLIAQFVSNAQVDEFATQEGIWAFRLWLQASHANCTLSIQVSRLNVDTFAKTAIHYASWPVPDTSLQQFAFDFEQPTPITIAPNERIVLELFCTSPGTNRTLTLTFDGVDRQTYVDVPVALLHNSQSGLQGGGGNERFHLTAAQHALIAALPPNLAGSCDVQVFEASATWLKPVGAKAVYLMLVGGGEGGESGEVAPSGSIARGGAGGAGGGITRMLLPADQLPNSCSVIVGAGGVGGAASSGARNAGQPGGHSAFGTFAIGALLYRAGGGNYAFSGMGGMGELFGAQSNPSDINGHAGSHARNGTTFSGGYAATTLAAQGAPAGGCGAGNTSTNSDSIGGGRAVPLLRAIAMEHDAGGGPRGGNGLDGYNYLYPGGPGAGGGSSTGANGGAGGKGGKYGAGGGGGGASRPGFLSGPGGAGGPGVVVVITFF